jgi:hypothetical protein
LALLIGIYHFGKRDTEHDVVPLPRTRNRAGDSPTVIVGLFPVSPGAGVSHARDEPHSPLVLFDVCLPGRLYIALLAWRVAYLLPHEQTIGHKRGRSRSSAASLFSAAPNGTEAAKSTGLTCYAMERSTLSVREETAL